jgi:hypothetical protein
LFWFARRHQPKISSRWQPLANPPKRRDLNPFGKEMCSTRRLEMTYRPAAKRPSLGINFVS